MPVAAIVCSDPTVESADAGRRPGPDPGNLNHESVTVIRGFLALSDRDSETVSVVAGPAVSRTAA